MELESSPRPTFVYRLYGESDALLYIGMACNIERRLTTHAQTQAWWNEVTHHTSEEYPSREDAFQAEKAAIRAEQPKYNKASKNPSLNEIWGVEPKVNNGYPADWHLLQFKVPPELWKALQLNKIATGVSVAEYIRETLTAAICHTS